MEKFTKKFLYQKNSKNKSALLALIATPIKTGVASDGQIDR